MINEKKITRSRTNRIIGGVAAGLADYLNIDPAIIRVLFVFLACVGGSGIVLYVILLFIIPEDTSNVITDRKKRMDRQPDADVYVADETGNVSYKAQPEYQAEEERKDNESRGDFTDPMVSKQGPKLVGIITGLLLIIFGSYILLAKFFSFNWSEYFFPALLLCAGVLIILLSTKSKK